MSVMEEEVDYLVEDERSQPQAHDNPSFVAEVHNSSESSHSEKDHEQRYNEPVVEKDAVLIIGQDGETKTGDTITTDL